MYETIFKSLRCGWTVARIVASAAAMVVAAGWFGDRAAAGEPLEYNRDIRPILAENCFACHGADSAARKADLRLDKREFAVETGAIEPGKPDGSELLNRVESDDEFTRMPPPETKKSLTAKEKEILRRWIAAGAEYQPHWSFIPPKKPDLPDVKNGAWAKNEIDRFVLARLEAHGLTPSPEADARKLFRRLHLDITGLPPQPEDIAAFVDDYGRRGDMALSEWIDRLMDSPEWGEHRARYWLDAARYADTHGLHFDNYREMWPYRDWVIRAFNANEAFDKFIVEQLAGDLLPHPTDDQLIATGFQRCNITTNEGGTIDEENLANYAVDRVQTFGWVFLGLTTNCGQCHDHKFDPFTMRDFYSLAAFFRNTTQGPKDRNVKEGGGPILVVPSEEDRPRWEALPGEIAAATKRRDERKRQARTDYNKWLTTVDAESFGRDLPTDGLVLHLPLDEGKGSTVHSRNDRVVSESDPSEVAARKVLTATAAGDVTWIDGGKFGKAPLIEAGKTFDLGQVGDFEKNQPFSYGAWVKPANKNASGAIFARMDEQASHRGWDLWQNGNGFSVHVIDAWPGNAFKVTTRNAVVKPGQWQHVFATYDGSGSPNGVKIYVDGKEQPLRIDQNTLKGDASIRTSTPLRIGQRSQGAVLAGSAVQDVRIYSRRLTPTEVKAIGENAAVRGILATAADKRTPKQKAVLYDYYLATQDAEYPALAKAVVDLEAERDAIRARSPVTHIQKEKENSPAMAYILMRGEYDRPTEQVAAATPAALHPMPKDAPPNRLGLAEWVVDAANPLTARVTVNRFWQQVFGRGIVETTENFGTTGALPTHPELLDWLAIDFQENGWNVKRLFKQMLMSATYRQSAAATPEQLEQDRDNSLLSRGPRFRMDAEMIRDLALAAGGLLSNEMYGPSVKPYQPEDIWSIVGLPGGNTRNYVESKGDDLYRRTVYTFWKRMAPPPNLEAFNAPSREVCTVRRERTNTPLQALVTLNDPQFVEAARYMAQQVVRSAEGNDAAAIDDIALRLLGRKMSDKEHSILQADKDAFLEYYRSKPEDAAALISVGQTKPDATIDPSVLAAWTMVCNEVINLDEALNK